jgi:hypothetical protein
LGRHFLPQYATNFRGAETGSRTLKERKLVYTVKQIFLKIQELIHEGANQKLIVPEFSEFNFQEFFHEN